MQSQLPSNVARFEQLMYLSFGLSLVDLPALKQPFGEATARVGTEVAVLSVLIAVAIGVLLIWQAARRHKNWARWVLVIVYCLSLLEMFDPKSNLGLLDEILKGSSLLAAGGALFFAFSGNARPWFEGSSTRQEVITYLLDRCPYCSTPRRSVSASFCTRCGTTLQTTRSVEGPSAWKSIPFPVRMAIYFLCVPTLIAGTVWLLIIVVALTSLKGH